MNTPNQINRRSFVRGTVGAAAMATSLSSGLVASLQAGGGARRKKVALIATEVRRLAHAQHFVDRFLEGYGWQGKHHHPEMDLVSLYVDQFPEGDLSRDRERRHPVRIYPTIAEALCLGTSKLAVDGVVIIGEHGKYPKNEKGQTLYPRYEFFQEATRVFEASGKSVPIFNDKHLSTDWAKCVEMVKTSKRLGFPFLAGSSLPVTWRLPATEIPVGTPLSHSVCVCYGGIDSYDFHGLETAQCMSERRQGGESGIRNVHALRGEAVWERLERDEKLRQLFLAALARSVSRKAQEGYAVSPPSVVLARQFCKDPVLYLYEHVDGFHTSMFMMSGYVTDFTYAGLRKDNGRIISCLMYLPMPPTNTSLADFFNPLTNHIEQVILKGKLPYPIERTLLTSGMTLFAVESLFQGQKKIETPEMQLAYSSTGGSHFWRA